MPWDGVYFGSPVDLGGIGIAASPLSWIAPRRCPAHIDHPQAAVDIPLTNSRKDSLQSFLSSPLSLVSSPHHPLTPLSNLPCRLSLLIFDQFVRSSESSRSHLCAGDHSSAGECPCDRQHTAGPGQRVNLKEKRFQLIRSSPSHLTHTSVTRTSLHIRDTVALDEHPKDSDLH
jgi:hypothetical protein